MDGEDVFEKLKKNGEAGDHARTSRRSRSVLVAVLLIVVVLLSAGSGLYAGASFFAQQAPSVTVTTTIFTTTTSWTTSTIWSTIWTTVEGILTTVEYTTSTSTVTVSASDTYTKLLLHMDGTDGSQTFIDSSLQPHSITAKGNAQIDTAQSKFGGASGLFDGNGDYLSLANSDDWNFGTGDFTVDFWIRRNGNQAGYAGTVGASINVNSGWTISFGVAGDNRILVYTGGAIRFASSTTIADLTWTHVALVRYGNTLTLYFNGISVASADVTGTSANSSSTGVTVGRLYTNLDLAYFNGWLDEVRVSKGIARWTSNFTPPTAPY